MSGKDRAQKEAPPSVLETGLSLRGVPQSPAAQSWVLEVCDNLMCDGKERDGSALDAVSID